MVVKIRDNLSSSDRLLQCYQSNTWTWKWSAPIDRGATSKCIGTYEYINSVYEGKFDPNTYRFNPVTIKKGTASCSAGSISDYRVNSWGYSGNLVSGPLELLFAGGTNDLALMQPYGTWDTQMEGLSIVAAYNKLNGPVTDVAVMLAELGETIHMLRHPFAAFQKFLDHGIPFQYLKKGRIVVKDPRSVGRRITTLTADNWLMYRYGIVPLMADIESLIKSIDVAFVKASDQLRSVHGGKQHVFKDVYDRGRGGFYGPYWTSRQTKTVDLGSHTVIYYRINAQSQADLLRRRYGFAGGQLPSVVWEKIPYSFVVDWFARVGDWLTAIMPNPSVSIVGSGTSQKSVIDLVAEGVKPLPTSGNLLDRFVPSKYVWHSETLIRRVGTTLPALPVLNPDILKVKRILDSLALTWNQINKRIKR